MWPSVVTTECVLPLVELMSSRKDFWRSFHSIWTTHMWWPLLKNMGGRTQWMAKAEKKRGRQQALDNAAAAASGDVGAMLRVATGSAQQPAVCWKWSASWRKWWASCCFWFNPAAAFWSSCSSQGSAASASAACCPCESSFAACCCRGSAACRCSIRATYASEKSHRRRREEQPPAAAEMDSHAAETPAPMTSSKSGPPQPPADLAATHICGICLEPMERGEPCTDCFAMHACLSQGMCGRVASGCWDCGHGQVPFELPSECRNPPTRGWDQWNVCSSSSSWWWGTCQCQQWWLGDGTFRERRRGRLWCWCRCWDCQWRGWLRCQ